MAWALYQAGQYAAAYDFSRQALQLGTQDALLLFHAGMIAERLGLSYRSAIRFEPGTVD